MEKLFYDLSEHEFSRERKILLWIFSGVFFLAGLGIIFMNTIQHNLAIHISFSIAPFGISIFVGFIAIMATRKRKDHFFIMDDEKIEYRFGLLKPVKISHKWADIQEMIMPHKEKKVLLRYKDGSDHIVNFTWLEKKKTYFIRKHFYYAAREKNISLVKVINLPVRK